mmetsp:Transcript_4961/g.11168  ORF Transcript_4961/g.11168 Transcript_4961/m.11168 type:complete len:320 (-) Transcript_4961:1460-2419(-)
MQGLLELAGNAVRAINPRLLPTPPAGEEETGHDVCFLGVAGEDDYDKVVYCDDLPHGQRGIIGSWYLDPQRHAVEYVVIPMICFAVVRSVLPTIAKYPEKNAPKLNPPNAIKLLTLVTVIIQVIYKTQGYRGKILFMLMPCNVLWLMYFAICFLPLKTQTRHIMYQLMIPYIILPVVAVATPDLSDLVMWLEDTFFFCSHYALIAFPMYLLCTGRIVMLQENSEGLFSSSFKWWLLSCATFGFFYFGIVTPVAILSGFNLNYMLNPPPNPGDIVSGPHFRLMSIACCGVGFFLSQLVATSFAVVMRWLFRRRRNKRKSV